MLMKLIILCIHVAWSMHNLESKQDNVKEPVSIQNCVGKATEIQGKRGYPLMMCFFTQISAKQHYI